MRAPCAWRAVCDGVRLDGAPGARETPTARARADCRLLLPPHPAPPTLFVRRACRLFIAAEVVSYDDFKACLDAQPPALRVKGFAAAKAAGKYRTEGRAYVVADGDICYWKIGQGSKK